MPQCHFSPWSQPILPAALDFLVRGWTDGPLDLSGLVAVVPTAEAARRIREGLAERAAARGTAVLAPHLVTPEVLTSWAMEMMPAAATPAESLLLWTRVLGALPLEEYPSLFPVPPVSRDTAWARSTAGELLRLRHRLEEGGHTMAMAAARLGPGHPEAARWHDLARLEVLVQEACRGCGLMDPVEARLAAAEHPVLPPGVLGVVLLAVPDPVQLVITALENIERQGFAVEVLVHADPALAETFDCWGRPRAELWTERVIDIPQAAERIRLLSRPADEAGVLFEALQNGPSGLAMGSADPSVAGPLEALAARAGMAVFDPNGVPLASHELTWLLTTLASLLQSGEAVHAARLLHLPDLLRAAPGPPSVAAVLREWDLFQLAHLPRTLADAVALLPQWQPRQSRQENPDAPAGLPPVLVWLDGQCRAIQGAGGMKALYGLLTAVCQEKSFSTAAEAGLFHAALEAWMETLEALESAARRTGFAAGTVTLIDCARHLLQDARLYPDNAEDAPALSGWLELPWRGEPHLIVAGLNEGMVPDSITSDAWLPDSVRGGLDLKTNAVRLARDSYLLTSLIESRRPHGRVELLAARESAEGDPLKPGRLLLRCPEDELPARALQLFPEGESGTVRPPPPSWHRAWKLRLPAPDLEAPVFRKMSVTQFADYLSCPFRFYLKHVLRMAPFDAGRDEMDHREFGSLLHETIQQLHENPALRDSMDPAVLEAFLDETVCRLTRARFGPDPALPVVMQLESARSRLRALARVHAGERAAGWRMEHVEVAFPSELEGVEISGRMDLIERHAETGRRRVLDYKTGSRGTLPAAAHVKALRGKAGEIPEWQICHYNGTPHKWINLQLPFYVRIASSLGSGDVTTGYVNLPAAATESAVHLWEELDDELAASAMDCARGVIRSIRAGRFWPPQSPEFDDFKPLWFDSAEESFDPEMLLKFMELRGK